MHFHLPTSHPSLLAVVQEHLAFDSAFFEVANWLLRRGTAKEGSGPSLQVKEKGQSTRTGSMARV